MREAQVDYPKLRRYFTDVMVDVLHKQQHGETPPDKEALIRRWLNEPVFHAQVRRAVDRLLDATRAALK